MTASGASVILQACDAASNTVFQNVVGVLKVKVTRNGGCRPATMTALVASDPLQDGPTSGLKRFYPFMGIRVVESDDATVSSNDRLYFSGRVDSAFLKEDDHDHHHHAHAGFRDMAARLSAAPLSPGTAAHAIAHAAAWTLPGPARRVVPDASTTVVELSRVRRTAAQAFCRSAGHMCA